MRAHPAAVGRRGGEELGRPRQALVERRRSGPGELDEHRAAAEVEARRRRPPPAAASGKKYMSSAGGDPGAQALGDGERVPAATVVGSTARRLRPAAARARKRSRSRSSASPRNIVIARWAWALTNPGTTMPPPASITGRRRSAPGPAGADRGDPAVVDEDRGVVDATVAAASIVTTVASTIAEVGRGVTSMPSVSRTPRSRRPSRSAAAVAGGDDVGGVDRHVADAGGEVGRRARCRAPPCRRGGRRSPRARSTCRRGRRRAWRPCGSRRASRSAGRGGRGTRPRARSGRRSGRAARSRAL